ncbi:MAG: RDD family protein [Anaeroplasmataceae bacterium]|nr:RDD family protein [Anaeroplasmataceae bacterium]
MKYLNATSFQRFFAFLIDSILISIVGGIILALIPAYNNSREIVMEFYKSFTAGAIEDDLEVLIQILKHACIVSGLNILIQIPLYLLYLVVLPYYWEKQTLGRWAMHLKVLSKDESKAKLSSLILREMVGGLLLLNILSSSIVIPILFWYFSATTGRSLADMIGGTRLVNTRYVNEVFSEDPSYENRDFVDATFKEVKEETPAEEVKEEDTDYKVF